MKYYQLKIILMKLSHDSEETRTMCSKNDNIEVMMGNETDKIIEDLFYSFFQRYQRL